MTRHLLVVGALCVVSLAWLACGPSDRCEKWTARCEGNTAATCIVIVESELEHHTEWRREECGDRQCTIVSTGGRNTAICAVDGAPDPRCPAGADAVSTLCEDDHESVLSCRLGYVIGDASCAAPTKCLDLGPPSCTRTGFCTDRTEPDPLCAGNVYSACAGNDIVYCLCGMRRESHPCSSPGPTCVILTPADGTTLQTAGCR